MTYAEGEGSGKTTMAAAKENSKSSFAVTCGLLSRYLRENKGGALQGLAGLDMAPPAPATAVPAGGAGKLSVPGLTCFLVNLLAFSCCKLLMACTRAAVLFISAGAFQPPTTMNLLSGLEDPKPDTVDVELAVHKGQLLQAPTGNQDAHQLTIFYGGKVVVVDNFPSTEVKALLQMANAAGDGTVDRAVPQSLPGPAEGNLPGTSSYIFCSSDKVPEFAQWIPHKFRHCL
jgi:jasmonate ZIM domain-containing protein